MCFAYVHGVLWYMMYVVLLVPCSTVCVWRMMYSVCCAICYVVSVVGVCHVLDVMFAVLDAVMFSYVCYVLCVVCRDM